MKVEQLKAELVVFKGLMSNVSPSPISDPAAVSYLSGGACVEKQFLGGAHPAQRWSGRVGPGCSEQSGDADAVLQHGGGGTWGL